MTTSPFSSGRGSAGLTLAELMELAPFRAARLKGDGSVRVVDVVQDSRLVAAGALFVARTGGRAAGADFLPAAVEAGAVALLCSQDSVVDGAALPQIQVSDVTAAMAWAAEAVHGFPSSQLPLVGITGTNGKTTCAVLVEQALLGLGLRPARLGTIGLSFMGSVHESKLTTPLSDELSRIAAATLRQGGTQLVMEVSSHALALGRVQALRFDVAAFTNLSQDHLDHHGTMAAYEAAKLGLFTEFEPRVSVINIRDEVGHRFAQAARSERVIRVGPGQEVDPSGVECRPSGIRGRFLVSGKVVDLDTRYVGAHNLENLGIAIGILEALGLDVQAAVTAWQGSEGVPGRLERCDEPGDDITVLVDYAHTPDALLRVLEVARSLSSQQVWCVFGCGGDRDPGKRPQMGDIAGRLADRVIVTNDNPRSESPEKIAEAIVAGIAPIRRDYRCQLDRALAIEETLRDASPGDVVLIAGKGHEDYQLIGSQRLHFDDREIARAALQTRRVRMSR